MKFFPHTDKDIREMLDTVHLTSLDDLFHEIPESIRYHGDIELPSAQSEIEVRRSIGNLAARNRPLICFAGGGAYDHYTPSVIPYLMSRSEFSTSYTPYQAEISQGTLQYIFEYQTLMARLTGMEVSNASMYDGATATAEAMMMCVAAAKKRHRVLVSTTLLPQVLRVVETYAHYHGVALTLLPATADGVTDRETLLAQLSEGDVAGVILPQTNRWGCLEDLNGLGEACHTAGSLLVVYGIAAHLAVLKSPGALGADIACGDAQSLGIPLNYGGPYIGYLCTLNKWVRKMPGRLVGETLDADGKRCFVLTLQAREQHIRREKATSNICTAQGFQCLHVALYLSLMGSRGLHEVIETSKDGAHALATALTALPFFALTFPQTPFLNEFSLTYQGRHTLTHLREAMAGRGFLLGIIDETSPQRLTIAMTEQRTPEEVTQLIDALRDIEENDPK